MNEEQLNEGLAVDVKSEISDLVFRIRKAQPNCRETSLVITKLEEASMWYSQIPCGSKG